MDDKATILTLLRKIVPNAEIPSTFGYTYDQKVKNLTILVKEKGLKANMQTDEAAFESWSLALKFYLKEYINTITIDWERDLCKEEEGYFHYNRFIYRLSKFLQTYIWARSAKNIPSIPNILYCNIGKDEAAGIKKHADDSEGWLECKYVEDHSKDYDVMNHQFPVGIFDGKVSKETRYTTGGKSAIDIWAIKDDCLNVFELKKADNKPLGIISELMFYTNILDDILSHRIMYDESDSNTIYAIDHNIRGFKSFYEIYEKGNINSIKSMFLADNLHPLLTNDLIDFINDSPRWKYRKITFRHKKVN